MKTTFASKCLSIVLMLALSCLPVITTGCSTDEVIASLQTADSVVVSAESILAPVNAQSTNVLAKVDTDLKAVIKGFQDYEAAEVSLKGQKAEDLKATLTTIQGNLSAVLQDVGVKNPGLVRDITVAVAVVNSAVVLVLNQLNATPAATTQSAVVSNSSLPLIATAKSHKDLKKAWNNAIAQDFPRAKI